MDSVTLLKNRSSVAGHNSSLAVGNDARAEKFFDAGTQLNDPIRHLGMMTGSLLLMGTLLTDARLVEVEGF